MKINNATLIFGSVLLGTLGSVFSANAQPSLSESQFLDEIRTTVNQSPTILSAEANIERARATANKILAGPYLTQIQVTAGQRKAYNVEGDQQNFDEWSSGLFRTIRLPGKRRIDESLAEVEIAIAETEYRQQLIDEQILFINLWGEWAKNQVLYEVSLNLARDTNELAELEQAKVESGAGRQLYANQISSEAKLAILNREQLALKVAVARAGLTNRFPNYQIGETAILPSVDKQSWNALLASEDPDIPAVTLAKLRTNKAILLANRAYKDTLPDPTIGVDYAEDFDGEESSVMARLIIPFGGNSRRANARESEQNAAIAQISAQTQEREAIQRYNLIKQAAQVASELLTSAETAADLAQETLNQVQQGYVIGAVTISDLFVARRSYEATEKLASAQQVEAISIILRLQVMNATPPSAYFEE